MARGTSVAAATVALLIGLPAIASGAPQRQCTAKTGGGEWATYGQDLLGQQRQDGEDVIGTSNVGSLQQAWITGDTGYQSAPPIVSGGCVFINTGGHIEALDLYTGAPVWQSPSTIDTTGTYGVTVAHGRVHLGLFNGGHPVAAALDVTDGHLLWVSDQTIYFDDPSSPSARPANQEASAIVFDGMQILFTTGNEGDLADRPGYGIIDAETGHVLYKATTLPEALYAQGYRGGGVWGTPTVDERSKYLYVGTANPESKTKESPYDNAILKLDLDRSRPTFGHIVATYKGDSDSATGYDTPACTTVGDTAWYNTGVYAGSPACGQTDVDFGSGPTLWRNAQGRLMGALTQKSGTLHVFYADTMTAAWSYSLFPSMGFVGGEIGRIATDGATLYVPANPGVIDLFDAATGALQRQIRLVGLPMRGGNVALANHVLYYTDDLYAAAWDPATGTQLWRSPVSAGASIGNSIAVAGHMVISNHFGTIAAYHLG